MSLQKTQTTQAYSLRRPRLVSVVLLGLLLCQPRTMSVHGAEMAADPYDVLYDVIMTRSGPDGKEYGQDESSPSIFKESRFPFGDKAFGKFDAALDEFRALPQEKIEAYSDIQRALLQRHLWQVFDATIPFRWIADTSGEYIWGMSHVNRRQAVRPKIASLIQRLALTKAQILALPDTRAATVESGGFPRRHDPRNAFKPFLSADLYSEESSWVGIDFGEDPPAPFHQNKLRFRSAFLTFMRLPGGRIETLDYVKKGSRQPGDKKQFPAGTEFALIEQAFLISNEGEMILSPLIVSVSLRAYLDVKRSAPKNRLDPTQSVAEFVMQPRQLMQGNAGMKALGQWDIRYEAGDVDIHGEAVEPFEDVPNVFFRQDENDMLRKPRLKLCMSCHKGRGRSSVMGGSISDVKESSPKEIVNVALRYKRNHETWKLLSELWQDEPANDEQHSDIQVNPPGPSLKNATAERQIKSAFDPYDALYDVIMTRYQPDGTSYGQDETSPVILSGTRFPFDDHTFEKLNTALDAFAALPQAKIEEYSDIKRAMLQSHLWKVYDATHPTYRNDWIENGRPVEQWGSHPRRRAAVRPKIASLIHRLALTKEQIKALPNTRLATMKSGTFAEHHDPDDLLKPFLPADLLAKNSSWVALGQTDDPIPADTHSTRFKWRAAFMTFIRAPGGREESLKCVEKYNRRAELSIGTQFALVEQAFLISDDSELVLSPLTVGISLRAYVGLGTRERDGRTIAKQSLAEFVMQPRELMRDNAVMEALGPEDMRYEAGGSNTPEGEDPARFPRLENCRRCHGGARTSGLRTAIPERLTTSTPEAIIDAILAQKRDHQTWQALQQSRKTDLKKTGNRESSAARTTAATDDQAGDSQ